MTLEPWDIERFPLKTAAPRRQTPGQESAERFLREVQPGDLDRLTEHEYANPDERYRDFGVPTTGGGTGQGVMHYSPGGYNRPGRSYVDEEGEFGHLPGHELREEPGDYYLSRPPSYNPLAGLFGPDEDEEEDGRELEPTTYHVVTRPVGILDPHDRTALTEHRVHAMGNRYEYEPDEVWGQFALENPEFDGENNPQAEHEIVHVHPEEHHDDWHRDLAKEEEDFDRIRRHGLSRESDDILGHRAYRHEGPNGVVNRLWHNNTSYIEGNRRYEGGGWHTSRYDPRLSREQQDPWLHHMDNEHEDSLGHALAQVDRNMAE